MIDQMLDYLDSLPQEEKITEDSLVKIFKLMGSYYVELKSGEVYECILDADRFGALELKVHRGYDGVKSIKVSPKLVETLLEGETL